MKNLILSISSLLALTTIAQARLSNMSVLYTESSMRIGFKCDADNKPVVKWISAQVTKPYDRAFEIPVAKHESLEIDNLNLVLVTSNNRVVLAQVTEQDMNKAADDCDNGSTPQIPAAKVPSTVTFLMEYDSVEKNCESWQQYQLGVVRWCEYTDRLTIRTDSVSLMNVLKSRNTEYKGIFWPTGG